MNRIVTHEPLTRESLRRVRRRHRHRRRASTIRSTAARPSATTLWPRAEAAGPNAHVLITIFKGTPYEFPLKLSMVERHPFGSQAFMPLSPRPVPGRRLPRRRGRSRRAARLPDAARPGRELSAQSLARRADADRRAAGFPGRRPRRRRHQPRGVPFLASVRNPPAAKDSDDGRRFADRPPVRRDRARHRAEDGRRRRPRQQAVRRGDPEEGRPLAGARRDQQRDGEPALARRGALPEAFLRDAEGRPRPTPGTASSSPRTSPARSACRRSPGPASTISTICSATRIRATASPSRTI